MKARCIKETNIDLIKGKIYDVISIENGWYRIVDESGEDYLYSPETLELL